MLSQVIVLCSAVTRRLSSISEFVCVFNMHMTGVRTAMYVISIEILKYDWLSDLTGYMMNNQNVIIISSTNRCVRLDPKWVRLTSDGTNPGLFIKCT